MNRATRARSWAALTLLTALAAPGAAHAFCTFNFHPWADACEPDFSQAECDALVTSELNAPSVVAHSIPVYVNLDTTTFQVDHPNYPGDPGRRLNVHRSLTTTGLTPAAVTDQVRAAIALWNQSAAGRPTLYFAGATAMGDTAIHANRPVGIVIDAALCWDDRITASAYAEPPTPEYVGDSAYRARITVIPYEHSVAGEPRSRCRLLPDDYWPHERTECPADDPTCVPEVLHDTPPRTLVEILRTTRVKDGFQGVLVHELGHTLGLAHNFFTGAQASRSCGLGVVDVETYGVMSYDIPRLFPRRDDIEGMRALYASSLPADWPLQAWRSSPGLPASDASQEATYEGLRTTVPPVLSNHVPASNGRIAVAYADAQHQVRARTLTSGVLDAIAANTDVPLAGQLGKTFTQPAVALATNVSGSAQLMVMWNEEQPTRVAIETRWALKTLPNGAWSTFGPASLIIGDPNPGGVQVPVPLVPTRVHPPLGVTYDAAFDDYVVATMSSENRPALTVINRNGVVTFGPVILRQGTTTAEDVNALGAPVCLRRPPSQSLCLVPIATSGDTSRVGVLAVRRTGGRSPSFSPAVRTLGPSTAIGFGHVNVSYNERSQDGFLSYTDDRGDVRWLQMIVSATDRVSFTELPISLEGNGRYTPGILAGTPREVIEGLRERWPVCPYWPASSGAVGTSAVQVAPQVNVVRAMCGQVCGDGYFDGPPHGTEQCDGDALGGETCESLGFTGGTLSCTRECRFSVSGCTNDPVPGPGDPPDPGDCQEILASCGDVTDDGCYPDGPGSFGRGGDGEGFGGFFCPDNDGPAVCGFSLVSGVLTPTCTSCPEPGAGGGDAPYGCACDDDADCAAEGLASTSGAPNGTMVPLSCFGSTQQGWAAGAGRCLPAIDPDSPQLQTPEQAVREEFERTRWLCKSNCAALTAASGVTHVCHYRQGGLEVNYAVCVAQSGCEVEGALAPEGACEEQGGTCDPDTNVCGAQCSSSDNAANGNAGCAARGYPSWYRCTSGWAAGLCVPPECVTSPLISGLDPSACEQFLGADVY